MRRMETEWPRLEDCSAGVEGDPGGSGDNFAVLMVTLHPIPRWGLVSNLSNYGWETRKIVFLFSIFKNIDFFTLKNISEYEVLSQGFLLSILLLISRLNHKDCYKNLNQFSWLDL